MADESKHTQTQIRKKKKDGTSELDVAKVSIFQVAEVPTNRYESTLPLKTGVLMLG